MTANDAPANRQLPLTEPQQPAAPGLRIDPEIGEATIRSLVDAFYESIRSDALLGPIFTRHVTDWSLHLPKMYDFWSTVVLRTGRYAGRPLEVHQRLPELSEAHFVRWLDLWRQTVARVVPESSREAFVRPARAMAASMSSVLLRGAGSTLRT